MKKTTEEILQEQGMEQVSIYDILYPERKGAKTKDGSAQTKRRIGGNV